MPYDGAVVLKIKGTMLMPLHHTEPYRIPFDVPELAFDEAVRLGLTDGYMQEKSSAREEYTPPFDLEGV